MAVKKHELVADKHNQLDLTALAQYLQLMIDPSTYLPPSQELVRHCQDIVRCLARTTGTSDQLWQSLQPVEQFLLRVVTTVNYSVRQEIFIAILDKFYSYISDPQSDACPATAAVLIVIDESDEEATLSIARWLVQRTENGPAGGAGLRAALSCLYRWLHEWHGTAALGYWTLAYIKALEENDNYDILIETSVDNMVMLFSCINTRNSLHQHAANVIFHILASLRESVEAFDRISPKVGEALVNLASARGQYSRQHLQDLVDILSAMVERITSCLLDDAHAMFQDKYSEVVTCLEQHMASQASTFLQQRPWRTCNLYSPGMRSTVSTRKVGLINLGNTCYMNSVVQALFVVKQFSSHVALRSQSIPYWEKLGEAFAYMMHSFSVKLYPDRFFRYLRPPFFTLATQHDSSEFLGYLLDLLQCYEHVRDSNYDYSRPPIRNTAIRRYTLPTNTSQPLALDVNDNIEPGQSIRSVSPRPGSSEGSSSSGTKRSGNDVLVLPPRKRHRMDEFVMRRESFVDNIFGGVLLTRVQCTVCQASSLSRDLFRDLQLAFPEKPESRQFSVQSLLEYYCSKESLTGDNMYRCSDCGCLRDAERSVLIERTPKFLILVLKHFKFDSKLQVQTKLMHSVYYDHSVTLPTVRTQAEHATYNLFAAVIHAGTTLDSGHYYTLAKDNDEWHNFNDCQVSDSDETQMNKLTRACTPYILFYRRSDIEEGTAPSFEELPRYMREEIAVNNKLYVETGDTKNKSKQKRKISNQKRKISCQKRKISIQKRKKPIQKRKKTIQKRKKTIQKRKKTIQKRKKNLSKGLPK